MKMQIEQGNLHSCIQYSRAFEQCCYRPTAVFAVQGPLFPLGPCSAWSQQSGSDSCALPVIVSERSIALSPPIFLPPRKKIVFC